MSFDYAHKHDEMSLLVPIDDRVVVVVGGAGRVLPGAGAHLRVEGVVRFNGEPVQGGTVLFETVEPNAEGASFTARGAIDAQGRYRLGTFTERDGAVAGRHRAAVVPSNVGLGDDADHAAAVVVLHQYTSLNTSPLEFEVQRSSNQIDIELHSQ